MGDDPLRFEEAHDLMGAVYFQVECLADVSIAAATIWLGWSFSPTRAEGSRPIAVLRYLSRVVVNQCRQEKRQMVQQAK